MGYDFEYIKESIEISLSELKVNISQEGIDVIAGDLEVCLDNYSLSNPTPPNPMIYQMDEQKRNHVHNLDERDRVIEVKETLISELRSKIDDLEWRLSEAKRERY